MKPLYIILSIAAGFIILSALILILEAVWAARGELAPFSNPDRAPKIIGEGDPSLTYVVMGDSTAAGQGADYAQGIAMRTARGLAGAGAIRLVNTGVSGARMKDVLDDQLPAAVAVRPDIVLVSAGANDVTHLTSPAKVSAQLREVIAGLQAANPQVRIVITGAPAMSTIPRFLWPLSSLAGLQTERVNARLRPLADGKTVLFAELARKTSDDFSSRPDELFAADRFHPNAEGYRVWADALAPDLKEAVSL